MESVEKLWRSVEEKKEEGREAVRGGQMGGGIISCTVGGGDSHILWPSSAYGMLSKIVSSFNNSEKSH